jgi:hypothetical protein
MEYWNTGVMRDSIIWKIFYPTLQYSTTPTLQSKLPPSTSSIAGNIVVLGLKLMYLSLFSDQ